MDESTVTLSHGGAVRGAWREIDGARSATFLGVPFAEPPVGERRFAAPAPASWAGELAALTYGATPQRRPFDPHTEWIPEPSIPGEATLNVNVFTPTLDPAARLPVMVWIHGGGYRAGSPASPWYDGFAFNRDGVVTVTVSYRLGFEGFGFIPDAPHNRGLLDQIEALRWVRDNIDRFGGDPGRVTIAGQSAGGGSVWALLTSPAARGLFHAAIPQSGALELMSGADAERNGAALAELVGVDWTAGALAAVPEDRLLDAAEELDRSGPVASLDDLVADALGQRVFQLAFTPYVDGETLPLSITAAMRAGVAANVPVLAGATAHEFSLVGEAFRDLFAPGALGSALAASPVARVADDYTAAYGEDAAVLGQLITDQMFRAHLVEWADLRGPSATWLYDYTLVHPDHGAATHCAELPFVFDHLEAEKVRDKCHPTPPRQLAGAMHGAWVDFVTHHRAPWPTFLPGDQTMMFDAVSEVRPGFRLERRFAAELRSA